MDKKRKGHARQLSRLNMTCDIRYSKVSDEENLSNKKDSATKDISQGGICFISSEFLESGTLIQLDITLGKEEPDVQVRGSIVWSEEFHISGQKGWDNGLEFLDISERDKQLIQKYMDSQSS